QGLMEHEGLKLSAGICYESVFPYLSRVDSLKGADLLVNMTNDGWYLDTAGPHQHFAANVFRAAENRRPMLRAANNGISAFIDPWGRVTHRLDLDEPGVLSAEVSAPELPPSFYARNGDWFGWLCLTVCAAFLLAVFFL
ncbi:MAG TPA: apolipoprotein N-acyltransferase, partial [Elusimicrobiales bacterium]|nr:apolipoprotein N-acyltransferase [Elusimicrobiales bacterium]